MPSSVLAGKNSSDTVVPPCSCTARIVSMILPLPPVLPPLPPLPPDLFDMVLILPSRLSVIRVQ